MTEEPEPNSRYPVHDALEWIARERDAVWTAKLVVLQVERVDDIGHFGDCLREHQVHAVDWLRWARVRGVRLDPSMLLEPSFVTREPYIVGALVGAPAVLVAMERIESARLARYLSHTPTGSPRCGFERLLIEHLTDARSRLEWLRSRLRTDEAAREAVAE